jgi:hypothetical protein
MSDPTAAKKEEGEKFEQLAKNCSPLPKKLLLSSKNIGLGSGIRKKPIPDHGSRGQRRYRIPLQKHWSGSVTRLANKGEHR